MIDPFQQATNNSCTKWDVLFVATYDNICYLHDTCSYSSILVCVHFHITTTGSVAWRHQFWACDTIPPLLSMTRDVHLITSSSQDHFGFSFLSTNLYTCKEPIKIKIWNKLFWNLKNWPFHKTSMDINQCCLTAVTHLLFLQISEWSNLIQILQVLQKKQKKTP